MLKGIKFQLTLNKDQETLMQKHVGCCRWVYNHALAETKDHYKQFESIIPTNMLIKELPELKSANPWLREVDSTCLQNQRWKAPQLQRGDEQLKTHIKKGQSNAQWI